MTLQYQILPIPIGGAGLDSRSDPKVIPAPALAAAENVTFAVPGRLTKRAGFEVPGSATTADAVAAVGDSLFRLNRVGASVYDSQNDTFAAVSGPTSMGVEHLFDTSNALSPLAFDSCRAGGRDYLISTAWLTGATTEKAQVFSRSTVDGSIVTSTTTSSNARSPKVVAIGSTAYFLYVSGTNLLFASSSTGTIGASEVTVANNVHATLKMFDIAVTGSQILLAYVNTAGDIISGYVSTSGVLGSTNTNTPAATITCLGVAAVSGGNYGIMWGINSTQDVMARLYNSAGTAYAAAQTIDATTGNNIQRVVGCFDTAGTTLSVFYEVYAATVVNRLVKRGTLNTSASVGAGAALYRHSLILSKPWLVVAAGSDQTYIVLGHNVDTSAGGGLQSGAVIVKYNASTSAGQVVGGLLLNEAYGFAGSTDPGASLGEDGHTPSAQQYASGSVLIPIWIRHETAPGTLDNASVQLVSLTLNHADAFASVAVAGQLYVAGAQLEILAPRAATSGVSTIGNCEAAPLFYPEKITLTPSNSTGSLTNSGTYSYRFYWETYDGNGAIIRSTYAGNQLVTLGALDDTVTVTVPTLAHTNSNTTNRLTWLGVYRSEASGSIHYRVSKYPSSPYGGTNGFTINDPTTDTISFVDGLADTTITAREIDYQSSDPTELDNIAPPPHKVIAAGNNRVFLSGMEDPNLIWVSKFRATGEALHFNDALTISVDSGDGPITGLATWQDNLIIFREHQIYIVGGDGPDNFGLGGEFTPCRIISEDVGCIEQRSIVRIPSGIMFKSRKGYYITDGSPNLVYIGAMVERYNSEAVTSAVALTANHEVRITTSSRTMVYDYLAGQWATWTVPATHACLWQDSWVALDGTSIMLPTPTLYVDRAGAGYTMGVETGWIRTAALQGFMRVRRILFLGGYKGTHTPTVKIAYDYEESAENTPVWTDTETWDPSVIGNTAYQFQVYTSRQKCQSIKIRIEDGGATNAGFTLSEIALEVGLKQGAMRLPETKHT